MGDIWFKRKLYGWGWTPVTWQGWAVIAVWFMLIMAFAFAMDADASPREIVLMFVLPVMFMTGALIRICYLKGESPRWQWGKSLGDPE